MDSFQPGLTFIPVSRAEISARPKAKDKILLIHGKRLHDQNSSPDWVSAWAEILARFELPGLNFQPGLTRAETQPGSI
jgi:hypothetical protein